MASGVKYKCSECQMTWTSTEQDTRFRGKIHDACTKTPKGTWQPLVSVVKVEEIQEDEDENGQVQDTFINNWDTFLWDRGGNRGRALVNVDGHDMNGVDLSPDYTPDPTFWMLSATLVKQIEAGEIFLVNPPQVVELLIRQLRRQSMDAAGEELMLALLRVAELYAAYNKTHPPMRKRHKKPQATF